MQKRKSGGFTLVELVVVIAVLAILAGVGVVAYNGYIEKAREAADQELLGAVNTAFAAACAETGVEGHPAEANASLMHKKVNQVTADDISGFNDAFFMYFEGNEGKEFQVVEGLLYNKAGGFFYASLDGGNKIILGNGSLENKGTKNGVTTWEWKVGNETYTIKTKENDIVNFNGSTFSEDMTMEELMNEIGYVANSAAQSLKKQDGNGLKAVLTKDMQDRLDKLGYKVDNKDQYLKAAANALVVQAAEQSEIYTLDNIVAYMKKESNTLPYPDIDYQKDGMFSGTAAQGALQYGIIMGFLNSPEGQNAHLSFKGTDSKQFDGTAGEYYKQKIQAAFEGAEPQQATGRIGDLCTALRDCPEYQEYLNSGEGMKDIEGYLSALSIVRDNGDEFIRSGVIEDGYGSGNSDLTEMLSALFGG